MFKPLNTYRIQLHKDFTIEDLASVIDYLEQLGVDTIYASPIFSAVSGSTHGYDSLSPHSINKEIGDEDAVVALSRSLHKKGMHWLQDIVPNHMAFHPSNQWLMDVLKNGKASRYASYFDINYNAGKIMVPFLGASFEEALKNNEIQVANDAGRYFLSYFESKYPVNRSSEDLINSVGNNVEEINNNKELLQQIHELQYYRLCHWQETNSKINYRRFFTVNGLICLNMQNEEVFADFHSYIKTLLKKGVIDGLRIDHIDGLYDPTKYLKDLRKLAGKASYITVEKILQSNESLPEQWPVEGNTGYDYLSIVNNLFTNTAAEKAFIDYYQNLTGDESQIEKQLVSKKAHILFDHMGGELYNLVQLFKDLELATGEEITKVGEENLRSAIAAFLVHLPVYRYYGNNSDAIKKELPYLKNVFKKMAEAEPQNKAIHLLQKLFENIIDSDDVGINKYAIHFYLRCMQFSGPLMAKGMEDTLMYTCNRFVAHNEVGDSPENFGISMDQFHELMKRRAEEWPLSSNATATHDTKRGEDLRARLNVLTDLPHEWIKIVDHWRKLNADLKTYGAPDANDEYFIYQSIVGAYPINKDETASFKDRLKEYLQKAFREAKTNTNWNSPNNEYENSVAVFCDRLFDSNSPFIKSLEEFVHKIALFGYCNGLSQLILKSTCPGIPDIYQGTELWDLSYVDPDNRRPVDYNKRIQYLEELNGVDPKQLSSFLWSNIHKGHIKLWLTQKLLRLRNSFPELVLKGTYVPLTTSGEYAKNVIAFAREGKDELLIVILPLHIAAICAQQELPPQQLSWKNTIVNIPGSMQGKWFDQITHQPVLITDNLFVQDAFKEFPLAIFKTIRKKERTAGVLMHISSLPSAFSIGDLGPEAYAFADFLSRAKQRYWQLLPINPTEEGQSHSPYSALSSMAGNPLLISPELLVEEGLLSHDDIEPYQKVAGGSVNYKAATIAKDALLEKAWQNYRKKSSDDDFQSFIQKEQTWLDDYACYALLKKLNNGSPWYEWEDAFRKKDVKAIEKLKKDHHEEIKKLCWIQFEFYRQWNRLKNYCEERNVEFIGDLPFYVSYDSADVWSYQHFFSLDQDGKRIAVAGVPPDLFSEDGQLWGMPVFKWDVMRADNYSWWKRRLKKNMDLFHLVRLDHFRAFAGYWEVPASDETAKNGKWIKGPGEDFFRLMKNEFENLPFIAEDLGEITDDVHALRNKFGLPGMKILQFAFDEEIAVNTHSPHNYSKEFFAYTGTHDNNTTLGWWREDNARHSIVNRYAGHHIDVHNIVHWMARMAYASVAKTAIIPVQDILELDENARMNIPSSADGNWKWQLLPGQLDKHKEELLREWVSIYNR